MINEPIAVYETRRDNFLISTDKTRLQLDVIDAFLATSYWGKNRPPASIRTAIEHCMCFGVYDIANFAQPQQVGFARVLTDYSVFAYVSDVFIVEAYQGNGLGKWLMETVVNHPDLKPIYRWLLGTRDAHGLYSQFGFTPLPDPKIWMIRLNPDAFQA